MDWIPFHHPTDNFCRLSDGAKKFLVVQKALYITNGHIFRFCPKKVLRIEASSCTLAPKGPFTIQRTELIGVSRFCLTDVFLSTLQRTFFLKNLAPPFKKTFLAPDSPSTQLSESEIGFVPDFSKKVLRTVKQALRSASNCPFYFPTDKMMRSVTVLS